MPRSVDGLSASSYEGVGPEKQGMKPQDKKIVKASRKFFGFLRKGSAKTSGSPQASKKLHNLPHQEPSLPVSKLVPEVKRAPKKNVAASQVKVVIEDNRKPLMSLQDLRSQLGERKENIFAVWGRKSPGRAGIPQLADMSVILLKCLRNNKTKEEIVKAFEDKIKKNYRYSSSIKEFVQQAREYVTEDVIKQSKNDQEEVQSMPSPPPPRHTLRPEEKSSEKPKEPPSPSSSEILREEAVSRQNRMDALMIKIGTENLFRYLENLGKEEKTLLNWDLFEKATPDLRSTMSLEEAFKTVTENRNFVGFLKKFSPSYQQKVVKHLSAWLQGKGIKTS